MAKRVVGEASLVAVADAIRAVNGTTDALEFPNGMVSAVEAMPEKHLAAVFNRTVDKMVSAEMAGSLPGSFQRGNKNLKIVDLPMVTSVGSACFYECSALEYVSLPSLTTLQSETFSSCPELSVVNLQKVQQISGWGWVFTSSTRVRKLNFPDITKIEGSDIFGGCTSLTALILGANSVCELLSGGCFRDTPIAGYTYISGEQGYIYVPAALVDQYKVATNWAAFADKIRAIEDYPEVLEGLI